MKRNVENNWETEIINKRKCQNLENLVITDKDKLISDSEKVAHSLNNFFINVSKDLVDKLPKPNTKYHYYLKNPNMSSFFLNEIEPENVFNLLNALHEKNHLIFIIFNQG